MVIAHIYSHPVSFLSWSATSSVTTLTENDNVKVTNSSGGIVYWTEGTKSGTIADNHSITCAQGSVNKTWDFSNQGTGGAQITLTVSSSGGSGGRAPAAQGQSEDDGQGHGQGHGKGHEQGKGKGHDKDG